MKFENENWAQFKGETWKKEINVRDCIQNNYKPYDERVELTDRDV